MTARTLLGLCVLLALAGWAASNHLRSTAAKSPAAIASAPTPPPVLQPETAINPGDDPLAAKYVRVTA